MMNLTPKDVGKMPEEQIPALMTEIAALQQAIAARLLTTPQQKSGNPDLLSTEDMLLTAKQAAAILGVNPRWLYRHSKKFPFTRRLARKVLRFSEIGVRRYLSTKRA